jgi:hypothetical protein
VGESSRRRAGAGTPCDSRRARHGPGMRRWSGGDAVVNGGLPPVRGVARGEGPRSCKLRYSASVRRRPGGSRNAFGIVGCRWMNAIRRGSGHPDVYFITRQDAVIGLDGRRIAWSGWLGQVKPVGLTRCGTQDGSPIPGYPGVGPIDGSRPDRPIGEVLLAVRTATDTITARTSTVTERIRQAGTAGRGNSRENSSSIGVNRARSTRLSAIFTGSNDKRDGCVRHSARYDPPEPPCGRRCGTPSTSHRSWHTRRRAILTICCPLAASAPDDEAAMGFSASSSVGSADPVRFA